MLSTGKGIAGETLSRVELDDIRDHFASLSPHKPTPYLMAAWARIERGEQDEFGLGPTLKGKMLASEANAPSSYVPEPSARRRSLLLALVNGDHPGAMPLFDKLAASPSTVPGELGLALRFFAKNGQYPRAFRWIETKLMNLLPILPEREAVTLIGDVAAVQDGDSSDEGQERWRRDPHAAAVWPEIALALYWHQIRFHGDIDSENFMDAIRVLRVPDYRARPLVTLALAADYEDGVAEWAMAELRDDAKRRAWEARPVDPEWPPPSEDDPAWLPLMAMLTAWTKEQENFLAETFCQSERRRHLLISMLGAYGGIIYSDLLSRIDATPALSEQDRGLVADAIVRFTVRHADLLEPLELTMDDSPDRILRQWQKRRGKGTPVPIACARPEAP
jgi:hypothetical protein